MSPPNVQPKRIFAKIRVTNSLISITNSANPSPSHIGSVLSPLRIQLLNIGPFHFRCFTKLGRAISLRETLQAIYASPERQVAEAELQWWCGWAARSRLSSFRALAK